MPAHDIMEAPIGSQARRLGKIRLGDVAAPTHGPERVGGLGENNLRRDEC